MSTTMARFRERRLVRSVGRGKRVSLKEGQIQIIPEFTGHRRHQSAGVSQIGRQGSMGRLSMRDL